MNVYCLEYEQRRDGDRMMRDVDVAVAVWGSHHTQQVLVPYCAGGVLRYLRSFSLPCFLLCTTYVNTFSTVKCSPVSVLTVRTLQGIIPYVLSVRFCSAKIGAGSRVENKGLKNLKIGFQPFVKPHDHRSHE